MIPLQFNSYHSSILVYGDLKHLVCCYFGWKIISGSFIKECDKLYV